MPSVFVMRPPSATPAFTVESNVLRGYNTGAHKFALVNTAGTNMTLQSTWTTVGADLGAGNNLGLTVWAVSATDFIFADAYRLGYFHVGALTVISAHSTVFGAGDVMQLQTLGADVLCRRNGSFVSSATIGGISIGNKGGYTNVADSTSRMDVFTATGTASFSDNFNQPDGALGGIWTVDPA